MKKKLLSLLILCIMAVSIFFTGCSCSKEGLKDNPATDANVISNGGLTVVKGDYLYYINGYSDETTLTKDDNIYGKVEHSAIYRTKLVDGQIQKDKDGFLENTDLVVSKVAGFSNGGFYIIDDFIYYTTPYMNLDRDGVLQSSRVEFHRININGTDDKTLYTTSKNEDNLEWTIYKIDGVVYIATYVDSKIIIVNTNTQKVVTEIANSTSHAFLYETDYNTNMTKNSEMHKYIYFTRAISDSNLTGFKGNEVCKVNIQTGDVTMLERSATFTFELKQVSASKVYYFKTNSSISGLKLLFVRELTDNWNNVTDVKISNVVYSNYYICNFGDNLVIADDSNGTYLIENGVSTKISSAQKTILGMSGNKAYYLNSQVLYYFDVRNDITSDEVTVHTVGKTDNKRTINNSKYLDFDNQRVYVYCDYTSKSGVTNKYLNYIDSEDKERFVGCFEKNDIPAQPDQAEDYGKDPDVKYVPWID